MLYPNKKDTLVGAFLFIVSLHHIEKILSNKVVQS